jgi:hypothetical protein
MAQSIFAPEIPEDPMRHRFTSVVILLAASLLVSAEVPNDASTRRMDPAGLVVHEWGTFTSVAGEDGAAVEWVPPNGPQDLPCFVARVPFNIKGWLPATVRMETPVLYFYSPEERTVDVRVRFRQGIVSEWYPRADVAPRAIETTTLSNPALEGTIAWNRVRVLPRASEQYPVESGANHYYAARKTDASPIEVGTEREKFLFYRGIGNFALPLSARISADGDVVVTTSKGESVRDVMLFENKRGAIGYEARRATAKTITLGSPAPVSTEASVRASLTRMLVTHGLYEKEAAAMVETWRDSWFEEGTRLFYIVPQASIDAVLPLEITPQPAAVARVFVGRIELITPAVVREVKEALASRDRATIARHGRFLKPILARVIAPNSVAAPSVQQSVTFAYASAAPAPRTCR